MPRKRQEPSQTKLPKYVYIRRGWYIYRPYLGGGTLGKDVKLCQANADISTVWKRYEQITTPSATRKTLDWLFDQYLSSPQHAAKSPKTCKEYEKAAAMLSKTVLKSGDLFGQIDAARVTPGVIRKFLDKETAKVAANRKIAFLSVCYSWAVERDLLEKNPCKEVSRNTERPRDRYVTQEEYAVIYAMAKPWPIVQAAMEIAYLCRMRLTEVLNLKADRITDAGLIVNRVKGSRGNITEWNPRLKAAIDLANTLPRPSSAKNPYLLRTQHGSKYTESGFQTFWQRLMVTAAEQGIERFTFHDLKAAGISDTAGTRADKQEASGHKSSSMMDVYDRSQTIVKPAGE